MANPFQMPLRGTPDAPRFDGKTAVLLSSYLEDIELLGTSVGLTDSGKIKAAIRYADLDEAEVWQTLPKASAIFPDWDQFVTAVKDLYPGCEGDDHYCRADLQYLVQDHRSKPMRSQEDLGEYRRKFTKISSLLIFTRNLSELDRDDLFLKGFPDDVQHRIHHRLSVVKPDLHPDDPYPLANTITAAKFLLTGSAFRSSAFLPESSRTSFWAHPQPYQSATLPPFSEIKPESTAMNQHSFGRSCSFCSNFGHFTWTCLTVIQYIQARKAIQGADGHLYLPDGSRIPRFADLQFIRQCIDRVEAEKIGAMPTNTTHSRDPQPHITTGILTVTYPEPERNALLDIEPSVFTTSAQVSPSLSITDPEFQAYLAKAWDHFLADKAFGIRFTDVTDPPGLSTRLEP
jgi:hypothetical protein